MPIRFHLDENVHGGVADGLRRRDVDVTTAHDAALLGAADHEHLAFAAAEQRVLVTHDRDLLGIAAENPNHSGIVYCSIQKKGVGQIVRALLRLAHTRHTEDMRGQVEFL